MATAMTTSGQLRPQPHRTGTATIRATNGTAMNKASATCCQSVLTSDESKGRGAASRSAGGWIMVALIVVLTSPLSTCSIRSEPRSVSGSLDRTRVWRDSTADHLHWFVSLHNALARRIRRSWNDLWNARRVVRLLGA